MEGYASLKIKNMHKVIQCANTCLEKWENKTYSRLHVYT